MLLSPCRALSIICLARSARVEGAQASSASALPDDLNLSQALLNAVVRIWVVSGSKAASWSRGTIGITHPSLLAAIYYMLGAKQHTRVKNMPRGPKGERRPRDVIGNAVHVMRIVEDKVPSPEDEGKDPAAVALGRKGGKARAESMSAKRRKDIARQAAKKRWGK